MDILQERLGRVHVSEVVVQLVKSPTTLQEGQIGVGG